MKTLEEEALVYIDNNVFCDGITPIELEIADKSFIAGAKSRWVEGEKVKAQIEMLNKLRVHFEDGVGFETFESHMEPLQKKLKELEDESKTD